MVFGLIFLVVLAVPLIFLTIGLLLAAYEGKPFHATERGLLDFAQLPNYAKDAHPLKRFQASDGDWLSYSVYPSAKPTNSVLVFLHGSASTNVYLHGLASAVAQSGSASVYLPNIRGHFMSGSRHGDCDYIGQLEDDIHDLLAHEGMLDRNIFIGGHSSGGGLAMRFAGGYHGSLARGFILLCPSIPQSDVMHKDAARDWAKVNMVRLLGLLILNLFRIRSFNALPVIYFDKIPSTWHGKETLAYSYRLNTSMLPRNNYKHDLRALRDRALIFIGDQDALMSAPAFSRLFADKGVDMHTLAGIGHLDIVHDHHVYSTIIEWVNGHS